MRGLRFLTDRQLAHLSFRLFSERVTPLEAEHALPRVLETALEWRGVAMMALETGLAECDRLRDQLAAAHAEIATLRARSGA